MKSNSRAWLTSFGDLLTLLLCFFVLAIHRGSKAAEAKAQSNQHVRSLIELTFMDSDTSGKKIASKTMTESPHWVLELKGDSFRAGYEGLSDSATIQMRDFLDRSEGRTQIEFCSLGFDYAQSVYELVERDFSSRKFDMLVGANACRELKALGSEIKTDSIQLSAKAKQKNG